MCGFDKARLFVGRLLSAFFVSGLRVTKAEHWNSFKHFWIDLLYKLLVLERVSEHKHHLDSYLDMKMRTKCYDNPPTDYPRPTFPFERYTTQSVVLILAF